MGRRGRGRTAEPALALYGPRGVYATGVLLAAYRSHSTAACTAGYGLGPWPAVRAGRRTAPPRHGWPTRACRRCRPGTARGRATPASGCRCVGLGLLPERAGTPAPHAHSQGRRVHAPGASTWCHHVRRRPSAARVPWAHARRGPCRACHARHLRLAWGCRYTGTHGRQPVLPTHRAPRCRRGSATRGARWHRRHARLAQPCRGGVWYGGPPHSRPRPEAVACGAGGRAAGCVPQPQHPVAAAPREPYQREGPARRLGHASASPWACPWGGGAWPAAVASPATTGLCGQPAYGLAAGTCPV